MIARQIDLRRGHLGLPKLGARGWFILEGAALTLLGISAFALPWAAGLAATLVFGWLLLIGGTVSLVSLARTRGQTDIGWRLVSALAAVLAGVLVLVNPLAGSWTIALFVAAYLFATGVALGMVALRMKRAGGTGWYWLFAPAAVDIALGVVALFISPIAAPLLVGYLVGLDLIFSGLGLIALAASRPAEAW